MMLETAVSDNVSPSAPSLERTPRLAATNVLRRVVGRKRRGSQDVDDIVQEILLSVHAARHTYDPARPFLSWLMTIASSVCGQAAEIDGSAPCLAPHTFTSPSVSPSRDGSLWTDGLANAVLGEQFGQFVNGHTQNRRRVARRNETFADPGRYASEIRGWQS
jgi:hypothetical protein